MKTKTKIVQMRVDDTLYSMLKKEALQKDMTISELSRNILITWYFAHDFIVKDIKDKIIKE